MGKERTHGWVYMYSEELGMEIALSEKTGDVWTADQVKYTRSELEAARPYGPITKDMHILKKLFPGSTIRPPDDSKEGKKCWWDK